MTETLANCVGISGKAVSRDLKLAVYRLPQFLREYLCVGPGASAKVPGKHNLGMTFKTDEAIGISQLFAGLAQPPLGLFLAANKSPKFVALDISDGNALDSIFKEPFASLACPFQDFDNGAEVNAGYPLSSPKRAAFREELENADYSILRQVAVVDGSLCRFLEGFGAGVAAITLMALAVFSVFLRFHLAVVANHLRPPLLSTQGSRIIRLSVRTASAVWEIAPVEVDAFAGVFRFMWLTIHHASTHVNILSIIVLAMPARKVYDSRMKTHNQQLTTAPDVPSSIQSLGGQARAAKLSPEERTEIARAAAEARWEREIDSEGILIPKATHSGELPIGSIKIPVAVLENGARVITQRGMFLALGRHKNPSRGQASIDNRPAFLAASNLNDFIPDELRRSWNPVPFRLPKGSGGYRGNIAFGYDAQILPMVCHVYLDARDAGKLTKHQVNVAKMAKVLLKGFSTVGIIALVDEATGYQEVRDRRALEAILDRYLRKEFAAWSKKFPDEFYQEIFRLNGWTWRGMQVGKPQVVGHYTNNLVWERLAPNLLQELRDRNPKNERGWRRAKHQQFLTEDVGDPALAQHLHALMALMRASSAWSDFKNLVQRAFPKKTSLPMFDAQLENGEE